tara:strand:- start:436 stop:729 length:294 start_codon:yes stop_codon:yes gene_type:complete
MDRNLDFLNVLEDIIDNRIKNGQENSYVKSLVDGGLDRILKKIGEEAGEVIIAAKNNSRDELLNESADLLFHLLITLKSNGHSINDVISVLADRHAS